MCRLDTYLAMKMSFCDAVTLVTMIFIMALAASTLHGSVRHQHRHRHVRQDGFGDTAQQGFTKT